MALRAWLSPPVAMSFSLPVAKAGTSDQRARQGSLHLPWRIITAAKSPNPSTTGVSKAGMRGASGPTDPDSGPHSLPYSAQEGANLDSWGQGKADGRTVQGAPTMGSATGTIGRRRPVPTPRLT